MPNEEAYRLGKQKLDARKQRYHPMRHGRHFFVTHQTPGTNVTGQTSYVATTPTFLIYQSSASTSIVGFSMWLGQAGTVAGGVMEIAIGIDSANLYSSGGTSVTPNNGDMGQTTASGATFRFNPTSTAAPARFVWAMVAPAALGTVTSIDFEDGLSIGTTGSIAIYTFAATTGPSWRFGFEWTEE